MFGNYIRFQCYGLDIVNKLTYPNRTCYVPLMWTQLPQINIYPLYIESRLMCFKSKVIEHNATGAACQQRTLTPPDTWSCPTLGLACVLMSRPIFPELVLSPDFWISNTPRYFSFAYFILAYQKNIFSLKLTPTPQLELDWEPKWESWL